MAIADQQIEVILTSHNARFLVRFEVSTDVFGDKAISNTFPNCRIVLTTECMILAMIFMECNSNLPSSSSNSTRQFIKI